MAKTELTDLIIPLGIIGAGIYLAPTIKDVLGGVGSGVSTAVQGAGQGVGTAVSGAGTGISTAFQGTGTGISTATQGLGTGISTAGQGLGLGINKLGTGAGTIFESAGNAGGGILDSAGSFGSKIFDLGESILDVPDSIFDRTSQGIRNFDFGSLTNSKLTKISEAKPPVVGLTDEEENQRSVFSNFLTTFSLLNPLTAPFTLAKKGVEAITNRSQEKEEKKLPKSSSSSSSRSSSSRSSSSSSRSSSSKTKELPKVNISKAKDPVVRDYENKNLVSTTKTASEIKKASSASSFLKKIGIN